MSCCCNWNSASCDKACQMPSFHPPYKLKRKTIMMYIRLIFVSPCKVISTVVVHDCWFNSHKDVDPLCVFLMKSVSCGRAGLFSVCSLWVTLVCHCHHRLDILALLAVESMQECDESWVATTLQVFTAQDCSSKSSFQQLWEKAENGGILIRQHAFGGCNFL